MSSSPGWDRQTKLPNPCGWIQWQGTQVCMDIRCSCGHLSHIDDGFTFYIRCPKCNAVYFVNGHVELVLLTPEEAATIESIKEPQT